MEGQVVETRRERFAAAKQKLKKDAKAAATRTQGKWQLLLALGIALIDYISDIRKILASPKPQKAPRPGQASQGPAQPPNRRGRFRFALVAVLLAAAGGWFGWSGANAFFTDDLCARRHDLRVLTTPDAFLPLRAASDEFSKEMAEGDGCDVLISVNSLPSVAQIRAGLENGAGPWEPEIERVPVIPGPHPDVLVLGLTAQAEALTRIDSDAFTLVDKGSLASSPVVLAVPAAYPFPEQGDDLPALLDRAEELRLDVARPDPSRSEAALLATRTLYQLDSPESQGASAGGREATLAAREAAVSPAGVLLDSAAATFCHQAESDNIGAVVPEHVLAAFGRGDIPASLCGRFDLTGVGYKSIPITGIPPLDYPFVRVDWAGQTDRERDRLIERFRLSLQENLLAAGFDDPAGGSSRTPTARSLEGTLAAFGNARKEIQLLVLLDVSSSMGSSDVAAGSSLDLGARIISQLVDRLGATDWAELWSLPGADNRTAADRRVGGGPVTPEQVREIKNEVASLQLEDRGYSPIFAALHEAVEQTENPGALTVILVTDGINSISQDQEIEDPGPGIVHRLGGARLEILAVGPQECGARDLKGLSRGVGLEAGSDARCVDAAYGDVETLVRHLIARLRTEGAS